MPVFERRPVTADDSSFLVSLYADTRPDLSDLPLPAEQLRRLLRMQFDAQRLSYEAQFPDSKHELLTVDGQRAGRLWTSGVSTAVHIVDVSLITPFRRQGLATWSYRQTMDVAGRVTCSVSRFNSPSLEFHRKLGFLATGEDETRVLFEWNRA